MSVVYRSPVDLTQNELRNAVVQVLASAPATPKTAQIYYASGTNTIQFWNGTAWQTLSTGTTADATTGAKGIVQLAGDLAGSGTAAAAPLVGSVSQLVNGTLSVPSVRFQNSQSTGMYSSALNTLDLVANGVKVLESTGTATTLPLATTLSAGATITTGGLTISAGGATITGNSSVAGTLNMNTNRINNVTDPASVQDAATKNYVDNVAQGLSPKPSARVATNTETLTIAAGSVTTITGTTVDGVTLAVNDRVLILNAPAATGAAGGTTLTTQPANGLYIVTAVAANLSVSRDTSMDDVNDPPAGSFVFVEAGATWSSSGFVVNTPSSGAAFTYGTNNISWTQFSGAGEITAGTGLAKAGNTLSIENGGVLLPSHGGTGVASPTAHGVLVANGASAMTQKAPNATVGMPFVSQGASSDPAYAALPLGTSGVVSGQLPVANGGTASTTAAGARTALGTPVIATTTITGDGTTTTFTYTPASAPTLTGAWHVTLIDQTTGQIEYADITINQALNTPISGPVNQIQFVFGTAPASGLVYSIVVVG